MGVAMAMGDPFIAGWFRMEHTITMDDDWGIPILGPPKNMLTEP